MACGDGDGDPASEDDSGPLGSAHEIHLEEADKGAFDEPVEFGDLRIILSDRCSTARTGDDLTGAFMVSDAEPYDAGEDMPPRSYVEGVIDVYAERDCDTYALDASELGLISDDSPYVVWLFEP